MLRRRTRRGEQHSAGGSGLARGLGGEAACRRGTRGQRREATTKSRHQGEARGGRQGSARVWRAHPPWMLEALLTGLLKVAGIAGGATVGLDSAGRLRAARISRSDSDA
eukprot:1828522-Prymnesium_polylepis.1